MEDFKNRLYDLMAKKKITQSDIVEKTGLPKSSISMYLKGTRLPKQDKICLIADTFNVNPSWLMGFDVDMETKSAKIQRFAEEEAKKDFELLEKFAQLNDRDKQVVLNMIDSMLKAGKSEG